MDEEPIILYNFSTSKSGKSRREDKGFEGGSDSLNKRRSASVSPSNPKETQHSSRCLWVHLLK